MTRYLISFDDGAMTIPAEELPAVGEAAHAVLHEARAAGVWVTGGGVAGDEVSVVSTDGSVATGPPTTPHIGGFCIVEVTTHDEALEWAARFARACRCAQEVWALMDDPDV